VPQGWRYNRFLNRLPRHSCPSTRSRYSKKVLICSGFIVYHCKKKVEDVSKWSTGPCETSNINVVERRHGKCHRSFTTLRFLTEKARGQGARRVHLAPLYTWYMRPVYGVWGMRISALTVSVGQDYHLTHLRIFRVGVNVLSAMAKGSRLRCMRFSCSNLG